MHTSTYIYIQARRHTYIYTCIPRPLRPLDTRSTLPVLARALARARARGFCGACAPAGGGGEMVTGPQEGFLRKNPKPEKRIDRVGGRE